MSDGIKMKGSIDPNAVNIHADDVTVEGIGGIVQRFKVGFGGPGTYADVAADHPLPVTDVEVAAALATLAAALEQTTVTVANPTDVSGLASQTTLSSVLTKLSSDPATQTTLIAVLNALQGTLTTREAGTYAYQAGTAAATVDVPTAARLTRVSVLAGAGGAATVTIGAGNTITIPAGGAFDEKIAGAATNADVVIAGTVASYYVAWVA